MNQSMIIMMMLMVVQMVLYRYSVIRHLINKFNRYVSYVNRVLHIRYQFRIGRR